MPDLPLLGREEAALALNEAYERLQSGGAILITDEAGVGKMRLMQAFALSHVALVLTDSSHDKTTGLRYSLWSRRYARRCPFSVAGANAAHLAAGTARFCRLARCAERRTGAGTGAAV